jgi:multidrug transporter EmrE-like cation transporter
MNVSPPVLVAVGIFCTALAQILLKRASGFDLKTMPWFWYMAASAVLYGTSFIAYSRILKYYALNRIYPAMTVCQLLLVTLYGLYVGEVIGLRQGLGLALGVVSIYLILF